MEVAHPVMFTKLFVAQARVTQPPATKFDTPLIYRLDVFVCVILASVELMFNVVTLTLPSVTELPVSIVKDVAFAEIEPVRLF